MNRDVNRKTIEKIVTVFAVVCILFMGTLPVFAENANKDILNAESRITALEERLDIQESNLGKISERVSLSGLVEIETFSKNNYAGKDESDITLATVELGFDVKVSEWVNAHILLLWEEDDTEPMDVNQGYITIGDTEKHPYYLSAGKMTVPFGLFESNTIQSPLAQAVGESRESSILFGMESKEFYGSFYAFNGDINKVDASDTINSFGANVGYLFASDSTKIDVGAGWISNIADSDGLSDSLPGSEITDLVKGFSAHTHVDCGQFGFIVEYVAALDNFKDTELAFEGKGAKPVSWNVEAAYTWDDIGKEKKLAFGYQKTEEALALTLPEKRFIMTASMDIFENTALAVEYFTDTDYSESEGGTGDNANQVTVQLAVAF
ncbi:MAG: LbtU family siderophore porin [Nitrospinae bacterium]|nr:LbtU family siderophore porin [Nitrospinota bacterium]